MSEQPPNPSGQPVSPRNAYAPPPPPPHYAPAYAGPAPRRDSVVKRVLTALLTTFVLASLALNVYLLLWLGASLMEPPLTVETPYQDGDAGTRIVILPLDNVINADSAEFVRKALVSLRENKPDAIVLRVNSPGGSVSASDRIYSLLSEYRQEEKVPIVASFGNVAASGGYYVSCGADHIFAEPTTITGSIGVIVQGFTIQEMLDKIGVTPEVHHSDRATKKDLLSPFRSWDQNGDGESDDVKFLRNLLNHSHERFIRVVAEGRSNKLTLERIKADAIDSGAPFTAEEALAHDLVDEEGYIEDAIAKAAALAGLTQTDLRVTVIGLPAPSLAELLGARSPAVDIKSFDAKTVRTWIAELSTPVLEYRWDPQR